MSHQIETHGDQAALVSLRENAWHGLGTVIDEPVSAAEALKIAHLNDWNVRKEQAYILLDGKYVPIPGRHGVVRDNPFEKGKVDIYDGVTAGSQYTPIQNEEHTDLLDQILAESGAVVDTAGSLRGGKEVFVTMTLPDTIQVGGEDSVNLNLAALNSHDGSRHFRFIVTPIRVLCANTQAMAEQYAKSSFSVRHTLNATKGIAASARQALDLTYAYQGDFQAEADRMIQTELTNAQFDRVVRDLLPVDSNAGTLVQNRQKAQQGVLKDLFRESDTAEAIRGTRWAGYQAFTEYTDFFKPVVGKSAERAQVKRAESTLLGDSLLLKQRAWTRFAVPAAKTAAVAA